MWTTLVGGVRAVGKSLPGLSGKLDDESLNGSTTCRKCPALAVSGNPDDNTMLVEEELMQTKPKEVVVVQLQPDLWRHALTFLPLSDLCSVALVNRELHDWATEDRLWKDHCYQLCEGKQGTQHLLTDTNNTSNAQQPPLSWKQKYLLALKDSKRQRITPQEVSYYSWKLLYKRNGSNLGLRKFLPDGTYQSPYFGRCEWTLSKDDGCLQVMGHSLVVERDPETWGWIIGRGSSTVYHSVDVQTWDWAIAKGNSTVHYRADGV